MCVCTCACVCVCVCTRVCVRLCVWACMYVYNSIICEASSNYVHRQTTYTLTNVALFTKHLNILLYFMHKTLSLRYRLNTS